MAPSPAKPNRAPSNKNLAGDNRTTPQKSAASAKPGQKASDRTSKKPDPKPPARPAKAPAKVQTKSSAKPVSKAPAKAPAKASAQVPAKAPTKGSPKMAPKPIAVRAPEKPVLASKPAATKSVPVAEVKASRPSRTKATAKVPAVAPLGQRKPKDGRIQKTGQAKSPLLAGELPPEYGVDRLVAIPKDPEWTHLYWELSEQTRQEMPNAEGVLRLRGFDTTGLYFDGTNAPVALDIEVAPFARSWYAKLPYQGRVYTFEYGWITPQGEWRGVARSQPVGFEPGMANVGNQEEWISIASEELFRAAAGLGDGEGIQDLIRKLRERSEGSHVMGGAAWLTSFGSGMGRMELAPSSWAPSSAEFLQLPSSWSNSSVGSQVHWSGLSSGEFQPPKNRQKDFWLWVETELVLYGATEPDAQVTLMGQPLKLNPDGTFRVKFPFPHGTELKMDVRAVDRTGEQVREAKPAARRWTD